jgi:chromate transporter
MIAAAYGVQRLAPETLAPAVHGFKIVAVAVVAHAVVGMAWSLLRTPLQMACAAISATAALLATGALVIPVTIVTIAMAHSALTNRDDDGWAIAAFDRTELRNLVIWSALVGALIGAVQLAGILPTPAQLALGMARIGALVFGGGHAVLPLMEADAIAHGWMGRDAFLAGYGAAQALPGPLFSFAAFAGASAAGAPGALIALVAIFAPGLVLVAIALRWWERLKTAPRAQAFVAGANAAVVGVLAAALWDPLIVSGVRAPADAAVAVVGFALLQWVKAPSWLVVALVAGAGAALAA